MVGGEDEVEVERLALVTVDGAAVVGRRLQLVVPRHGLLRGAAHQEASTGCGQERDRQWVVRQHNVNNSSLSRLLLQIYYFNNNTRSKLAVWSPATSLLLVIMLLFCNCKVSEIRLANTVTFPFGLPLLSPGVTSFYY